MKRSGIRRPEGEGMKRGTISREYKRHERESAMDMRMELKGFGAQESIHQTNDSVTAGSVRLSFFVFLTFFYFFLLVFYSSTFSSAEAF